MKQSIRYGLIICTLLILSSCSLFKFTVSVGDKPMTDAELSTRMMVRGFYNDFTRTVIAASDSISVRTNNIAIRINALQWKMKSSSACADAAYGGVPEVAMLNTWVLCERMDKMMQTLPDTLLFGSQTEIARIASGQLLTKIENVARKYTTPEKFLTMEAFVSEYSNSHPMTDLSFTNVNLILEWADHQSVEGKRFGTSVGSIPEVMADMNDRISGYTTQFGNELTWSKQMFSMQIAQDSIKDKLALKLDSISYNFNKMVLIFEHSPQLINAITTDLNVQMQSLIGALNGSVNSAFYNITSERIALQNFVDEQRAVLIKEVQQSVDMSIKTAMDALPALIGKIVIYVVSGLIILLSVPFFAGFMLGKWRERKKHKNNGDK